MSEPEEGWCPECDSRDYSGEVVRLRARVAELEREREAFINNTDTFTAARVLQELRKFGLVAGAEHDSVVAERDTARAEVERLRALHDLAHAAKAEAEHAANVAREEVERLREALRQVITIAENADLRDNEAWRAVRRVVGAAIAGSPVCEGSPQTPRKLDAPVEYVPSLQRLTNDVRCRALAERVRLHVAEQFFLVMERGDVSLSDAFDKMRATPLDALLEEP